MRFGCGGKMGSIDVGKLNRGPWLRKPDVQESMVCFCDAKMLAGLENGLG